MKKVVMALHNFARLFHTLKHLRLKQVVYRLYYRIVPLKKYRVGKVVWRSFSFECPMVMLSTVLAENVFQFLGERGSLAGRGSWNDDNHSKLWLYNLHYLDDLNAENACDRAELHNNLICRWIAENPVVAGGVGWEPYPLSLRLVNLVKWYTRQKEVKPEWLLNLSEHAQILSNRLEYHILGNHLFANGKALLFAGAFLKGKDSEHWLNTGLKILDREVAEQFLSDGGHFELSPMYHATLLWDICDLLNLARSTQLPELLERKDLWSGVIQRGLEWLSGMTHPDGGIAFFNDAAFGIAPSLADIQAYAKSLEIQCGYYKQCDAEAVSYKLLAETGYCRVDMPEDCAAYLDIARIGPDHLPGHAHADTLSFELSVHGQRLLVNSGTSQYGVDSERHRQRSTAAHNSVVVNEENSSEVWKGFRVARRAYPSTPLISITDGTVSIEASHDGYKRLPGRNIHKRKWKFSRRSLTICDTVTGMFHCAVARFHFHPDVEISYDRLVDSRLSFRLRSGTVVKVEMFGAKSIDVIVSTWHPEFGASVPNICIMAEFQGADLKTLIDWGEGL